MLVAYVERCSGGGNSSVMVDGKAEGYMFSENCSVQYVPQDWIAGKGADNDVLSRVGYAQVVGYCVCRGSVA